MQFQTVPLILLTTVIGKRIRSSTSEKSPSFRNARRTADDVTIRSRRCRLFCRPITIICARATRGVVNDEIINQTIMTYIKWTVRPSNLFSLTGSFRCSSGQILNSGLMNPSEFSWICFKCSFFFKEFSTRNIHYVNRNSRFCVTFTLVSTSPPRCCETRPAPLEFLTDC